MKLPLILELSPVTLPLGDALESVFRQFDFVVEVGTDFDIKVRSTDTVRTITVELVPDATAGDNG